jgi:hypothetical protein
VRTGNLAGAVEAITRRFAIRLVVVSPPRTGSTPVARLLWEHPAITHHCHEPFEAAYWAGHALSAWPVLERPMAVATGERMLVSGVSEAKGLLVKEMSFQLDEPAFDVLLDLATAPVVFVMRDPRLAVTSRLRVLRELNGSDTFPPFESGWPSLREQVAWCRARGIEYALVDSTDLRTDPAGVAAGLLRAVGLAPAVGVNTWVPRPGLALCTPEVGALMSENRNTDDPFYRRVLASAGIERADEVDWDREEAEIAAARLTAHVAEWRSWYAELRADPARVVAELPA